MVGLITFTVVMDMVDSSITLTERLWNHMRKRLIQALLLFFCTTTCFAIPRIAVTIKPVHALVASIGEGIFEPELLLPDYASPHTYQLKPSTLKTLQQADMVIWVGPALELFMNKPIAQIHPSMGLITLSEIPGLSLLPQRKGRAWQEGHDHHHEHHEHPSANEKDPIDPHLWLSTDNAKVIVNYIATFLSTKDPEHALQYQHNAKKTIQRLDGLKKTLSSMLQDVQTQPFLVYHDGYQYFQEEFHLNGIGTIVLNPHLPLSAHSLSTIQQLIKTQHVKCVFRETEFSDTMVRNSLNNMGVTVAELDPLGARLKSGPDNYDKTLFEIGKTMKECLSK